MRLCLLLNYAPHYRGAVFEQLMRSADARILAGDRLEAPLRKVDAIGLNSQLREGHTYRLPGGVYGVRGGWSFLITCKPGGSLIVTGELSFLHSWIAMLMGRLRGTPVFLWSHGVYWPVSGWAKWIRLLYFRLATGVLLYHDRARQTMISLGIPADRLHVIYNSVDDGGTPIPDIPVDFSSIGQEAPFSEQRPIVLFTGRLLANKRLDLLVRAVHHGAQQTDGRGFNLVLVGDGAERGALESLAQTLGVGDRIWFHGEIHDPMCLAALFEWADVVASPGNVGLTAIHALRHGTPVITHDNPDRQMPEAEAIIDGVNGALFREGDYHDLAHVIAKWLERHPRKSRELREACHRVILDRYNSRSQTDRILRALDSMDRDPEHAR